MNVSGSRRVPNFSPPKSKHPETDASASAGFFPSGTVVISQRQLRQWIETSRDKRTDFLGEKKSRAVKILPGKHVLYHFLGNWIASFRAKIDGS